MGRAGEVAGRVVALVLAVGLAGGPSAAADGAAGAASARPVLLGTQVQPDVAEGTRIAQAQVRLDGTTGNPEQDRALAQRLQGLVGALRDVPMQRLVVDGVLQKVRRVEQVAEASYAVFQSVPAGRVVLVVTAVVTAAAGAPSARRDGVLVTGKAASLPVLYRDDQSLLKLILNGGVGAYATSNPFFGHADLFTRGNVAASHPAGPGSTAWAESYVEAGIGGVTRLADTPLYPYGAVTYLQTFSWGQDIYDSGFRHHGAFEQAYAGVVVDLPGESKGNALNVSAGRQIYQLRQGFLVSKIPGSTNLGRLAALWLGPRLAFDRTVVATLKYDAFSAEGIVLEPTEFPGAETRTRLAGATVGYDDGEIVNAALTYLEAPRSLRSYLAPDGSVLTTREGLRTISPSVWLTDLFGVQGLWFKGEFAWQTHERIDMSAYAFALWPGYRAESLPWKPGLSYRYTLFSGDDPATAKYERYDPLLSGGQNNYVPGMLLSSVLLNSNMRGHRVALTANPTEQVGLTLEYSTYRAIEYNNRGAIGPLQQLSSKDLAQELDLFCGIYASKNLYVQAVLAAAFPGAAIRDAVGGSTRNWYAAQLSLYLAF